MNEHKKDQLKAQADELTRESMAAFERWLQRHPEVIPCDANIRMFTAYADFSDGLTEADFDFCFSNIRDRLALQTLKRAQERATDKEANMRARLIDEIIGLLRSSGARYTEHDLRTERTKLGFQDVAQLQARRDSIVEKQRLSKMSVGQIRQELGSVTTCTASEGVASRDYNKGHPLHAVMGDTQTRP